MSTEVDNAPTAEQRIGVLEAKVDYLRNLVITLSAHVDRLDAAMNTLLKVHGVPPYPHD